MRFLRRGHAVEPIPDFWAWWGRSRDRLAEAIDARSVDGGLVEEITRAVQAVHPAMAWELAPGRAARHAFCLSPEGDPERRQAALRWLAGAPGPDATWEYHPSRQASPTLPGLEIAGERFDLEEMRAITSWDGPRRRLDVRLWHPGFARAPREVRQQVAFLFLDSLLGEDEVERWIGEVAVLDEPSGGRTPAELRAEVERRRTAPGDEATWSVGELVREGGVREVVAADAALKRIDHPFADFHAAIGVLLPDDGMPSEATMAVLDDEELALIRRLDGVAVQAGRVTAPSRRTIHVVTEDLDALRGAIDAWAASLPDAWPNGERRRIKVDLAEDMDWSFQRELGIR